MPVRVGFIVGKDNDLVEDPSCVSDLSFLRDLPDEFRVDPESDKYLRYLASGVEGKVHVDVAIAWHMQKHNGDILADIIMADDVSLERLRANDMNFIVGWDVINAVFDSRERFLEVDKAFRECGNIWPTYETQMFIIFKSRYMRAAMEADIPVAPTLFAIKGERTAAALFEQVKARGWERFIIKQSLSAFSLGIKKFSVQDVERHPEVLERYFEEQSHCPEFIVQEIVDGFVRNWETRCFWFNGEFQYAIANIAAFSSETGEEVIATGDDIPADFLEAAKRIGAQALKVLPEMRTPDGRLIPQTLVRTDIGCSDSRLCDRECSWDPEGKTWFLNEIEYGGTNYFARHLKFDCVPLYSELYTGTAREIAGVRGEGEGEGRAAKQPRLAAALKPPATPQMSAAVGAA